MTVQAMESALAEAVPRHPTFAEATAVWAKIGLLSFGGPAGQIALMHKELVEERRWIAESRFLHALNFCMLLPGPEAQQLATYIGWLLHGTRGGVIAGTLFVLPGFVVIVLLSAAYAVFHETTWLASLFFGLKAAVLAIVIEAVIRVGKRALKNNVMLGIAAAAFIALFVFNLPFPLVVLVAGIVGSGAPEPIRTSSPVAAIGRRLPTFRRSSGRGSRRRGRARRRPAGPSRYGWCFG